MATLLIAPIHMKSIGGYDVTITGIDPSNSDCLSGSITTPGWGCKDGCWDLSGLLRDGDTSTNLDRRTNEMMQLRELARKLVIDDRES
ncbi:MAG: hypothetical protein WCC64_07685 [Aliidongia sp.]